MKEIKGALPNLKKMLLFWDENGSMTSFMTTASLCKDDSLQRKLTKWIKYLCPPPFKVFSNPPTTFYTKVTTHEILCKLVVIFRKGFIFMNFVNY